MPRLEKIDPAAAERISANDARRITRALEVFLATSETQSAMHERHQQQPKRYQTIKIGIDYDRGKLYERINHRVERMFSEGMLDEVRPIFPIILRVRLDMRRHFC